MSRRALRAIVAALLCGFALLLSGTAPAYAHARLQSSDPADGASVATAPERVSLTFNENMLPDFTTLTVIGPDGAAYQTGGVTAEGGTVSTAVLPLGSPGRYEIGYRVVSDDGHPVRGSVAFTLTAPSPGATSTTSDAAPAPTDAPPIAPTAAVGGGTPIWPWIVGAVVLVAGGVGVALRLGRG